MAKATGSQQESSRFKLSHFFLPQKQVNAKHDSFVIFKYTAVALQRIIF